MDKNSSTTIYGWRWGAINDMSLSVLIRQSASYISIIHWYPFNLSKLSVSTCVRLEINRLQTFRNLNRYMGQSQLAIFISVEVTYYSIVLPSRVGSATGLPPSVSLPLTHAGSQSCIDGGHISPPLASVQNEALLSFSIRYVGVSFSDDSLCLCGPSLPL